MERVLVTGGAGFIGSNFLRNLVLKSDTIKVLNLDKLTYAGNLNNLTEISSNPNYIFCKGDICNQELVKNLFSEYDFDMVINFAAESHVDRSIMDSSPFLKSNILGTANLLDQSLKHGVDKFIQISTDEVYGSIEKGYFTEESALKPNSPYSSSKASADLVCRAFSSTYELPIIITRCTNNYGPYQFPEKLIPLIINNVIQEISIPVYGDGNNVRDWIHVDDHCKGILKVIEKGQPGEIYNLGGNCEKTNIDVVNTIIEKMSASKSLIKYVKDRPAHDRRYAVDISKAKEKLGWAPEIGFKQGIESTIDWYLQNTSWIKSINNGDYTEYYKNQYGKSEFN